MYKPSTYLVVTYFPTYLPMYETFFLQNWLPRWNQILTQLRFIGALDEARSTESRRLVVKSVVLPRAYRGREVDNA